MLHLKQELGTSLAVQWLGLPALAAEGPGLISGRGTRIPQATQCSQKEKEKEKKKKSKDWKAIESHTQFEIS